MEKMRGLILTMLVCKRFSATEISCNVPQILNDMSLLNIFVP